VSLEAPTYLVLSTIRAAAYGALGPDEGESEPLGAEAGLSPREVRVLGDIVRGFSNDEVAQRQGITLNTVKSNIRATYRKIGVTTRAQAVSWGLRNGFAFDDTWGGD
jgi:DNA-binding CsgD family transcriptional regulator